MLRSILFFIVLFVSLNCIAQNNNPKYEFRGVWIATIGGIDWPKPATRNNVAQQKADMIQLLDSFKAMGFNAVVFQVRPASDAFYNSSYEAWSYYLTGQQGMAPDPYYDPLAFIIEEAHKRCMELHAWFNPFRVLIDSRKNINPSNHFSWQHKEWCVNYGGKRYIDPGIPAARKYVQQVVKEVVANYDIDAVHMDDYFYPYKVGNLQFPDQLSFQIYGNAYMDKGDWRRDNVNNFISELTVEIKKIKPYVKFGISPFGIWRNIAKDAEGSNTNGSSNYDDLFADVRLWLRKGWIDYVLPQLYWERGHRAADYATLEQWWSTQTFGKHLYIGHGVYRIGNDKNAVWQNNLELSDQVASTRTNKNIQGSCMYTTNSIIANKRNLQEVFYTAYNKPAIIPPMKWIDATAPSAPRVKQNQNSFLLTCEGACNRMVVYCFKKNTKKDFSTSQNIEAIVAIKDRATYHPKQSISDYQYYFCVLDRMGNESEAATAL